MKMRRNWRKGQLRLGWAGHARGRGMAAGCRDNARLGKSFLIKRANESGVQMTESALDRDLDRAEISTPERTPSGFITVIAGLWPANPFPCKKDDRFSYPPVLLFEDEAPVAINALESIVESSVGPRADDDGMPLCHLSAGPAI
jgi:hypothetical protein